jgi:hypothetical protein
MPRPDYNTSAKQTQLMCMLHLLQLPTAPDYTLAWPHSLTLAKPWSWKPLAFLPHLCLLQVELLFLLLLLYSFCCKTLPLQHGL